MDLLNQLAVVLNNFGLSANFDLSYQDNKIAIVYIKDSDKFKSSLIFILNKIQSSFDNEDYTANALRTLLQESIGNTLFLSVLNANFALHKLNLDIVSRRELKDKMSKILDLSFLLEHNTLSWFNLIYTNIGIEAIDYVNLSVPPSDFLVEALGVQDYSVDWKRDVMANFTQEFSSYAIDLISMDLKEFKQELHATYLFYFLQLGESQTMDLFLTQYFLKRISDVLHILKVGEEARLGTDVAEKINFAADFYAKINNLDLSGMVYLGSGNMLQ